MKTRYEQQILLSVTAVHCCTHVIVLSNKIPNPPQRLLLPTKHHMTSELLLLIATGTSSNLMHQVTEILLLISGLLWRQCSCVIAHQEHSATEHAHQHSPDDDTFTWFSATDEEMEEMLTRTNVL